MENNQSKPIAEMNEAELVQFLGEPEGQSSPGIFGTIAGGIGSAGQAADAVRERGFHGLTQPFRDVQLLGSQVAEGVGLTEEGSAERLQRKHELSNEFVRNTEASQAFPTVGNVSEILGDTLTRFGAAGGAAGLAVKGAGTAAALGKVGLTGVLSGASRTPGEGQSRAKSAAIEGGLGVATLGAGKLLAAPARALGRVASSISDDALRLFEKAGMQPRLSQVLNDVGLRDSARGLERTLQKIPFSGGKKGGFVQHQKLEDIFNGVRQDVAFTLEQSKTISRNFYDVFKGVGKSGQKLNLKMTERAAFKAMKDLERIRVNGGTVGSNTLKPLDAILNKSHKTLEDAQFARQIIDENIRNLRKANLIGASGKSQIRVLTKLRKVFERDIELNAGRAGLGGKYKGAKIAFQDSQDARVMDKIFKQSIPRDQTFDPAGFSKKIGAAFDDGLFSQSMTKGKTEFLKGLRDVSGKIGAQIKPQPGQDMFGLFNSLAVGGGVVAGATAAGGPIAGAAVAGGGMMLMRGLNKLVTTSTGIKLIQKIGLASGSAKGKLVAQAMSMASRLGVAGSRKSIRPADILQLGEHMGEMDEEELQQYIELIGKGEE